MELSGRWRAAVADDDLRRAWAAPEFDDESWETIEVPGHWRSAAAFADTDGPLLYRRIFDGPRFDPTAEALRHWLVLDGLFYQGDVWLDGAYVGDTEGYFAPHHFDVTDLVTARADHVLAVEVACPRPSDLRAKQTITGVFQHWDCIDPDWNPGGIWRPIRIEQTGAVRINRLRLLCREADENRAVIAIRAELDAAASCAVTVRTWVEDASEHRLDQPLAAGTNEVEWTVTVDQPALWWPWSLGDQPLYEVTVQVEHDGEVSHVRHARTGLRRLELRDWILTVNGERLFVKGTNLAPTRMALAEAGSDELRRDVELAKEAGLDLLRVHAHVTRPELYAAADDAGMLVWQDFPLQWGYARGIRKQAVRQARDMVDQLGHHPSIALWCGHNEPLTLAIEPGGDVELRTVATQYAVGQQLPTWNRSILDRSVKRTIEKADPTRPVVAHSGILPHLPQLDGTDSHLYFGWYHGDERDLDGFLARIPRLARFVSEFGAQAVPADAAFMEPERWPDLDWERLARTHALQKAVFDRHVPPAAHATFDGWREATQRYQATLLKHHVETLRRLKYHPTGGFCQFLFADAHPAVTWSVLGHDRSSKAGYHALADACRPVIVVADRPPAAAAPGTTMALDVHVVSDRRGPIEGAVVAARLTWPSGAHGWRFGGDVPADACVRVGTLSIVVPDSPGTMTLDLDLVAGEVVASNRYELEIVPE